MFLCVHEKLNGREREDFRKKRETKLKEQTEIDDLLAATIFWKNMAENGREGMYNEVKERKRKRKTFRPVHTDKKGQLTR